MWSGKWRRFGRGTLEARRSLGAKIHDVPQVKLRSKKRPLAQRRSSIALRYTRAQFIDQHVPRVRHLILRHRLMALAIILVSLAMRALIPAGMMLAPSSTLTLTVTVCGGMGAVEQLAIPIERDAPSPHEDGKDTAAQCAYGGLGSPALKGADLHLLGLALLFAFAAAFLPLATLTVRRASYAWPHLRGPPLTS